METLRVRANFRLLHRGSLFDHLVGAASSRWHLDAERLCVGQVEDEIELGRLLDRDATWFLPTQSLVDIGTFGP